VCVCVCRLCVVSCGVVWYELMWAGFASSGLEVIEGHKPWVGDRVWISLNKIGLQNVKRSPLFSSLLLFTAIVAQPTTHSRAFARFRKFDIGRNKNAYDTLDFGTKNIWIKHLCLHGDDCRSDPAGVKVRAIQGKQAVTYLDPGLLTGSLSYVRHHHQHDLAQESLLCRVVSCHNACGGALTGDGSPGGESGIARLHGRRQPPHGAVRLAPSLFLPGGTEPAPPPEHVCARDAVLRPLAFGVYARRNAMATSPGS
jgi:hypothetical protein